MRKIQMSEQFTASDSASGSDADASAASLDILSKLAMMRHVRLAINVADAGATCAKIASNPKHLLRQEMGYGKHAETTNVADALQMSLNSVIGKPPKCDAKQQMSASCTMVVERMKRNSSNRECQSESIQTCGREPRSH